MKFKKEEMLKMALNEIEGGYSLKDTAGLMGVDVLTIFDLVDEYIKENDIVLYSPLENEICQSLCSSCNKYFSGSVAMAMKDGNLKTICKKCYKRKFGGNSQPKGLNTSFS